MSAGKAALTARRVLGELGEGGLVVEIAFAYRVDAVTSL
jgi:hypothetical protein